MLDLEDRETPVREPARSGPSEVQVGADGLGSRPADSESFE
ncbi:hypothetical protein [Streptomyces sp. AC602_WCS936]|nr:hypothetical protein [Streptomyces sp. AC602_WCS936]